MNIRDSAWDILMAAAGVIAAVLAVGIWYGCAAPMSL